MSEPSHNRRALEWGIRALFPHLMRSSVRSGLRGVWLRGQMPTQGAVIAGNHHSWWDGYLAFTLAEGAGVPMRGLMDERSLERMPFFRTLGAIGARELRAALRHLQAGLPLFVFPEGQVRPLGPLGPLHPGAAWLSSKANVPLVPLALRCVLRGHEQPEAYMWIGAPTHDLERDLNALLERLDFDLAVHDPERALPGFTPLLRGRSSAQERTALGSHLLRLALERL